MLPTEETTATEVYAHALSHGDKPVIHGAEIDYDDVHDGVHYHADLLAAARTDLDAKLADAEKARRHMANTALNVAFTVDLAEKGGRSPRSFATYADDLAAFRAANEASKAAHVVLAAAADRHNALKAKRDQDAAMATYEVSA
ncbi:MAG TPA: hypothetical protein VJL80_14455 [Aeromicrobium sp.]|nr:hypothetical protein [Aeromicrobium sp.]HKY59235.1 hypothetical protein [Aeromicrobium sp.]